QNAHQLQLAAADIGANYTLANNIDLTSSMSNTSYVWATNQNTPTGLGFNPIGSGSAYAGTFNGASHTINGLYINALADNAGLFGGLSSTAQVENLGLTNVNITDTSNSGNVGGVA